MENELSNLKDIEIKNEFKNRDTYLKPELTERPRFPNMNSNLNVNLNKIKGNNTQIQKEINNILRE
jgi:hypothetical protein